MKIQQFLWVRAASISIVFLTASHGAWACGGPAAGQQALAKVASQVLSTDDTVRDSAIRFLREQGPAGLEALFTAHADVISAHTAAGFAPMPVAAAGNWERLRTALDAVGEQKDCYASRLYWFTDFDKAAAAARKSGKPILSLRLLGKLDEEFSCANSRFFRTTLYSDAEISSYLRDHFILHWKSVRPVPKVTIDFGDGRKLERTLTGNSIHYVLDKDGRVIDALPGLYSAKAFKAGLESAWAIAEKSPALENKDREVFLGKYHAARLEMIRADWNRDLAVIKGVAPTAEVPALDQLEKSTDDPAWQQIAQLRLGDAKLGPGAVSLIMAKYPSAAEAGTRAISKRMVENPVLRTIRVMERNAAEDTARNEYLFHSKIHEWLLNAAPAPSVDTFNTRVYAQLFLTPESDPWLGLAPADAFAALENDGKVSGPQTTVVKGN